MLTSHNAKGSKLKPDAPEFVPQKVDIPSRQSSTKVISKEAAKASKRREKQAKEEQKRLEKEQRKVASKISSKKAANSANPLKSESRRISRLCNLLNSVVTGGIPRTDGAADGVEAKSRFEDPRTEEIEEVGAVASGRSGGVKPKRKR